MDVDSNDKEIYLLISIMEHVEYTILLERILFYSALNEMIHKDVISKVVCLFVYLFILKIWWRSIQ